MFFKISKSIDADGLSAGFSDRSLLIIDFWKGREKKKILEKKDKALQRRQDKIIDEEECTVVYLCWKLLDKCFWKFTNSDVLPLL